LGIGQTSSDYLTPQLVSGLSSGVTQIAASPSHACAIVNTSIYCWGTDTFGELGINSQPSDVYYTPQLVQGISGMTPLQITAGFNSTCAILQSGTSNYAYCWGNNSYGQLGLGDTTDRYVPAGPVHFVTSGGASKDAVVNQIDVGGFHACAIAGGVYQFCWGINGYGQVGDGTYTERNSPVDITGLTSVTSLAIAAGSTHSMVVGKTTTLNPQWFGKAWGDDSCGQLGDGGVGINPGSPTPVHIQFPADPSGTKTITKPTAGAALSCAAWGGVPYCWGGASAGALGRGTAYGSGQCEPTPGPVAGNITW
jgi:alpha-tubulin suppressor-like RCC1 family protein